jgi:K+-sensing histidine kinase KdpD
VYSFILLYVLVVVFCIVVFIYIFCTKAALLNIGAMVYYLLFVADRYSKTISKAQHIVPPVVMGACAVASLILVVDCCRHFIVSRRRKDDQSGPYRPLVSTHTHDYKEINSL